MIGAQQFSGVLAQERYDLMQVGLSIPSGRAYPEGSTGLTAAALRAFATTAEDCGYGFVSISEHVIGADVAQHPDWSLPWTNQDPNHDALLTFAHLAAVTSRIGFASELIVLPQRQTVAVAKQAADVARLSEGRLRLGVGIGRNYFEYECLGQEFRTRGRRLAEQIDLLRLLWTSRSVTFAGEFDQISGGGIWPLPERPIPIWMGGGAQPYAGKPVVPVLQRVGRLADGWISLSTGGPSPLFHTAKQIILDAAMSAGREPASVGFAGTVNAASGVPTAQVEDELAEWDAAGIDYVTIYLSSGPTGDAPTGDALLDRVRELAPAATS